VHVNQKASSAHHPISSGSALHTQIMKTELKAGAPDKYGFDRRSAAAA